MLYELMYVYGWYTGLGVSIKDRRQGRRLFSLLSDRPKLYLMLAFGPT